MKPPLSELSLRLLSGTLQHGGARVGAPLASPLRSCSCASLRLCLQECDDASGAPYLLMIQNVPVPRVMWTRQLGPWLIYFDPSYFVSDARSCRST